MCPLDLLVFYREVLGRHQSSLHTRFPLSPSPLRVADTHYPPVSPHSFISQPPSRPNHPYRQSFVEFLPRVHSPPKYGVLYRCGFHELHGIFNKTSGEGYVCMPNPSFPHPNSQIKSQNAENGKKKAMCKVYTPSASLPCLLCFPSPVIGSLRCLNHQFPDSLPWISH